jgi:hypothetical protein
VTFISVYRDIDGNSYVWRNTDETEITKSREESAKYRELDDWFKIAFPDVEIP